MMTRIPRSIALTLAVCLVAASACSPSAPSTPPPPTPAEREAAKALGSALQATVVYQRPDGIYVIDIGADAPRQVVVGGTCPRWAPNGKSIAFVHENRIMRVGIDGKGIEELARAEKAKAVAWHPNGREILYTDGTFIRAVGVRTKGIRNVAAGLRFTEMDVGLGGKRLAVTVRRRGYSIYAFDLKQGQHRKLRAGGSASLSPDSSRITCNEENHRVLSLLDWETGQVVRELHAGGDAGFDNHCWSNESDWIACIREGKHTDVLLHQVSTDTSTRVTFTGDCTRPDLYIASTSPP